MLQIWVNSSDLTSWRKTDLSRYGVNPDLKECLTHMRRKPMLNELLIPTKLVKCIRNGKFMRLLTNRSIYP